MATKGSLEELLLERWEHAGIPCGITRSGSGSCFNGYCQLPIGHPDLIVAIAYDIVERAEAHHLQATDFLEADFELEDWQREAVRDLLRRRAAGEHGPLGWAQLDEVYEAPGGLTYGPDGEGWIGFDTGHGFDCWPVDEWIGPIGDEATRPWWPDQQRMLEAYQRLGVWPGKIADGMPEGMGVRRWSFERLRAAVNALAEQAAARQSIDGERRLDR